MRTTRRSLLSLVATAMLTISLAVPAAADPATDSAVEPDGAQLGIVPLEHDGAWFDLELSAGQSTALSVELANHGDTATEAATYAADVYSLINGGMGVALHDQAAVSEVTGWIDYPSTTLTLGPDEAQRRTFTIAIPDDAAPGQYIAALALQHQPDSDEDRAGVSIDQVIRQAVAVNITIPGPTTPDLDLGESAHLLTAGRSTVRTVLDNTGGEHLNLAGEVEITGSDGRTVDARDLDLAIVYAGTSTHVETILDQHLSPGTYTITTRLADDARGAEASHTSTFEVEAPPRPASPVPGADQVLEALDTYGPLVLILAGLGLLLLLLLVAALLRSRRRHRATPDDQADNDMPATSPATPPPPPPPAVTAPQPAPPAPPASPAPPAAPSTRALGYRSQPTTPGRPATPRPPGPPARTPQTAAISKPPASPVDALEFTSRSTPRRRRRRKP